MGERLTSIHAVITAFIVFWLVLGFLAVTHQTDRLLWLMNAPFILVGALICGSLLYIVVDEMVKAVRRH